MTMNPLAQPEFDYLVGSYRPLLRISEASVILHDCVRQHVLNLIDVGLLRAFDLTPIQDPNKRRLLRLDRACCIHRAFRSGPYQPQPVSELLPIRRPTVQVIEIARWFGVDDETVTAWDLPRPSTDRRSLVLTADLIQFLAEREIPLSPAADRGAVAMSRAADRPAGGGGIQS